MCRNTTTHKQIIAFFVCMRLFFLRLQFSNVISFCLSLKMAEDHVCTCARGFPALQGESMFMQCVEFDEFPHLSSLTRLFYMDASVSVCYNIYGVCQVEVSSTEQKVTNVIK